MNEIQSNLQALRRIQSDIQTLSLQIKELRRLEKETEERIKVFLKETNGHAVTLDGDTYVLEQKTVQKRESKRLIRDKMVHVLSSVTSDPERLADRLLEREKTPAERLRRKKGRD